MSHRTNRNAGLLAICMIAMLAALAVPAMGMDAPKISEIRAQETLWHFLLKLPGSMEAQTFYGLSLAGTMGMAAHYTMQWLRGSIAGSLVNYLFTDNPRSTLLALAGVVGLSLTAITSNVFVTDNGEFVGWLNVLWFGLTQGYAADSVANKGKALA